MPTWPGAAYPGFKPGGVIGFMSLGDFWFWFKPVGDALPTPPTNCNGLTLLVLGAVCSF